MVRHQQGQATVPHAFLVIVRQCCNNSGTSISPAKLVPSLGNTFDRDEEPTAVRHPLWNRVRQLPADQQIHDALLPNRSSQAKREGRARHSVRAVGKAPATHERLNDPMRPPRSRRARSDAPYHFVRQAPVDSPARLHYNANMPTEVNNNARVADASSNRSRPHSTCDWQSYIDSLAATLPTQ